MTYVNPSFIEEIERIEKDCFNYPSLENNGDLSDGGDRIVEDDAVKAKQTRIGKGRRRCEWEGEVHPVNSMVVQRLRLSADGGEKRTKRVLEDKNVGCSENEKIVVPHEDQVLVNLSPIGFSLGIGDSQQVFVEDGGGIPLIAGEKCIGKDRNGSTLVEDEDNMTNVPLSWAGESFWDEVIAIEKTMDEKVGEGNGAGNNMDSAEMESEDYDFDLMGDLIERKYPKDWDPLKVGLGLEVGSTSGKDISETVNVDVDSGYAKDGARWTMPKK
ncbi:unnamed protein product [Arabis nemorensis]|uniref:Uncharacterized protein n=1 Tax=Arabis nemorensis TaxID=586526 RepID=A0A565CDE8_9BRAS|nr:unnamed protein product [Arabis nemorensis]